MDTQQKPRRGSALVIVLGILAVMMLMAVAFSTFVRTERGASTNLKNSFVARTSLLTAVGRVMEAIDTSFGSATNNDPVAAWPKPWLASGPITRDYFQSAALGDGETAGAHVLTSEIEKYLTPAQLALVRAAKCDWAPIYSSISASPANSAVGVTNETAVYGNYGRPVEDSLVGRYAFVALDTTGLLDMNQTRLFPGDRTENSGDPTTFIPYSGTLSVTRSGDNQSRPAAPFVKNPDAFFDTRDDNKVFYSMADARALCDSGILATNRPTASGAFFPADLVAGFAPSLTETNPEGTPKISLPSSSEFDGYSNSRVKKLLGRVYRAMVAVFARSRAIAGISVADSSTDTMKLYQSTGAEYTLSPAALATISLMDGIDSDNVPGRVEVGGSSLGYWNNLNVTNVMVEGVSVREDPSAYRSMSNLDFPCTESVPLADAVRAEIKFDSAVTNKHNSTEQKNWTVEYSGKITVSAYAHCANKTEVDHSHSSKIKVEWEVMQGSPRNGTTSGNDPDNPDRIRRKLELEGTASGGGGGQGRPPSGGGGSGGTTKLIDWSGFFQKTDGSAMGGEKTSDSVSVNDGSSQGSRSLAVSSSENVKVICHFYSNLVSSAGSGGGNGGRPPAGGSSTVVWKPYPMTAVEHNKTGDKDVFVSIRVRVTILDADNNDKKQQQVPGPAIDDNNRSYWICVNPGVYHNPGVPNADSKSQFGGNKNGSAGDLAFGWAFCAVPAFGFDTTGLLGVDAGNDMNFWVNDTMARNAADESSGGGMGRPPAGGGGGGGNPMFSQLKTKFWSGSNPNDAVGSETMGWGRPGGEGQGGGDNFSYMQRSWLVNDGSGVFVPSHVTSWVSKGGGRVPDMLHASSKGGNPFVVSSDDPAKVKNARRNNDLYARIPLDGYATVADLGRVMCGPYETLSLFKTWRPNSGRADFHPVMDYFTMEEDRYPTRSQIESKTTASTGEVDWKELGSGGKNLYSAIHNGRVNLNAPPLVELESGRRGKASSALNPYPIAAVLNGAPTGTNSVPVPEGKAALFATTFCDMLRNSTLSDMTVTSEVWPDSSRKVVRNLSFLGMGQATRNTILEDIVGLSDPDCDIEREGMLGGIIDGFSTRGQTYLVIIRADAYSPQFGENSTVSDGTSLATTHAIVELFRDPVPALGPDGETLPTDGTNPVAYHNWYIRSFRVF